MYRSHKDIDIKNIQNIPLWRYMDLWKFLKIINSSSLFFPSVNLLGDQLEGKIPDEVYSFMKDHEIRNGRNDNFVEVYKEFMENYSINSTLVLSWNAAENESFALWKMYAKDKLGIAIKTNFNRLKESFNNTNEDIYIGEVKYYNKNKPKYDIVSFSTLLTKHNYYSFEREVRCLTKLKENEKNINFKNVDVNLNTLIEDVYLSPFAFESGLHEIIEFLKSKHNLNFNIKMSGINDTWL